MLIERIEDKGLSHYSYALVCEGAGQLAIVDPRRDVDVYLEFARARDWNKRRLAQAAFLRLIEWYQSTGAADSSIDENHDRPRLGDTNDRS